MLSAEWHCQTKRWYNECERVKMQENKLMLQMAQTREWERKGTEKQKKHLFNGYFRRDKNHFVIYLVEQRNLFGSFSKCKT